MFLLRLSLRTWRRSFLTQGVFSLCVAFLLVLTWLLLGSQFALKKIILSLAQQEHSVLYLSQKFSETPDLKKEKNLMDSIRFLLSANPSLQFELVSKEQLMEHLLDQHPELAREFSASNENVKELIPKMISIRGKLSPLMIHQLKELSGVEGLESTQGQLKKTHAVYQAFLRLIQLLSLGVLLILFSALILFSRSQDQNFKDIQALLDGVGALFWVRSFPSVFSSALVGLCGGSIAALVCCGLEGMFQQVLERMSPLLSGSGASVSVFFGHSFLIMAGGLLLAFFSACIGSFLELESDARFSERANF